MCGFMCNKVDVVIRADKRYQLECKRAVEARSTINIRVKCLEAVYIKGSVVMLTRREAVRACLVALLALTISLLVGTVQKDKVSHIRNEFDAYEYCDLCPAVNTSCVSVHGLLVLLTELCGNDDDTQPEVSNSTDSIQSQEEPQESNPSEDIAITTPDETTTEPKPKRINEKKPREDDKDDESSPVIYQIIGLLLIVSVSFSLVECTKEKWGKNKQPNQDGVSLARKSLTGRQEAFAASRKMSLADLTISRHERRDNQASYRQPAAELPKVWTRRSSVPGKSEVKPVTRQISWPHASTVVRRVSSFDKPNDEDAWAERRRVRMLHRH